MAADDQKPDDAKKDPPGSGKPEGEEHQAPLESPQFVVKGIPNKPPPKPYAEGSRENPKKSAPPGGFSKPEATRTGQKEIDDLLTGEEKEGGGKKRGRGSSEWESVEPVGIPNHRPKKSAIDWLQDPRVLAGASGLLVVGLLMFIPTVRNGVQWAWTGVFGEGAMEFSAEKAGPEEGRCAFARVKGAGEGQAPPWREPLEMARCYMVFGHPSYAERELEAHKKALINTPFRRAARNAGVARRSEAYHLLLLTYLRQGRPAEADRMIGRRCDRWRGVVPCVAKLAVYGHRGLWTRADRGFARVKAAAGKMPALTRTVFWWAGARIAENQDRLQLASRRYRRALKAAPKGRVWARQLIYDSLGFHLYGRGLKKRVLQLARTGVAELAGKARGAAMNLKMMAQLSASDDPRATLRKFFRREDVAFQMRSHRQWIFLLGPEAIQHGLETPFLRLLERTRRHHRGTYQASSTVMKELDRWRIRAVLAANRLDEALELARGYEKRYRQDAVVAHLAGTAYLMKGDPEGQGFQAIDHFNRSVKRRRRWENLFGLSLAMIRAGKTSGARRYIKDLEDRVEGTKREFWAKMLRAEWHATRGDFPKAQRVLRRARRSYPNTLYARQLEAQILRAVGKPRKAGRIEAELKEQTGGRPYFRSPEGLTHPVGFMAFSDS